MMRLMITSAVLMLTASVHGAPTVIADYGADFETDGSPKAGWSYLWNANGPLTDALLAAQTANFVPLVYDSTGVGGYQSQANGAWPDAAPGSFVRVTGTEVYPGQTATQNAIQRYAILSYTVNAADIAAYGNELLFHTYSFSIPQNVPGNIDVYVFKNQQPLFFFPGGFPSPGFSDAAFGPDYSFGQVQANDTLYIALGAQNNYQGEPLGVAFTLALVPEPATLALAAFAPVALMRRRH